MRRIVSLVPSLTETLCDLGLRSELVACTQFCIEPPGLHKTTTIIGGPKDFDCETILSLQPTHILANEEENPRERLQPLAEKIPTLITFPKSPQDVGPMLRSMGAFLNCPEIFTPVAESVETRFTVKPPQESRRYLYFIWKNPYMVAGQDSYISRVLAHWGWENACEKAERYPVLSLQDLARSETDLWLFSSEPYPFRKRDAEKIRSEIPNAANIYKIDGKDLSWYGTRSLKVWDMMEAIREKALSEISLN